MQSQRQAERSPCESQKYWILAAREPMPADQRGKLEILPNSLRSVCPTPRSRTQHGSRPALNWRRMPIEANSASLAWVSATNLGRAPYRAALDPTITRAASVSAWFEV